MDVGNESNSYQKDFIIVSGSKSLGFSGTAVRNLRGQT